MPTATRNELQPRERKNVPISFRVTKEFNDLLDAIAEQSDNPRVEVVIFAVRELARRKGIRPAATDTGRNATEAG